MMSANSLAISTAVSYGYADIRILERRRVVDAVAQVADRVASALQRPDHARLLQRRHLGENGGPHGSIRQFGISQGRHILAQHRIVDKEPNFLADLAHDDLVVACDDLDVDAVFSERRDGFACRFLRWIKKGHNAGADWCDPSPFPPINPVVTVPMLERYGLAATRTIEYGSWLSREIQGGKYHAEHGQGTRDLSCAVCRRFRTVQFLEGDLRVGRGPRLQGGADPDLGRPPVRSGESCGIEGLL